MSRSFHKSRHEAQLDVVFFEEGVFVQFTHLLDVAGGGDDDRKVDTVILDQVLFATDECGLLTSKRF